MAKPVHARSLAADRRNPNSLLLYAGGAVLALAAGLAAMAAVIGAARAQDGSPPDGAAIFESAGCIGCHGANGEGIIGPRLAGNPNVDDINFVLNRILTGGIRMPSFASRLSDAEIAAVATFIRTSWGNATIEPEQVAERRTLIAPTP